MIPSSFLPRRILVCQQRQIGDVLLITPALALLRDRFPDAAIHVLTERKCLPMLENNPHVDHVWSLDKKAMPTLAHEVRWYWKVARNGYDLVINFQPTLPRLRWVVGFSGAAVRLSATPPWYLRPLYTDTVPPTDTYAPAAKVAMLAPLGIAWNGERPRLYLRDAERTAAAELLAGLGLREGEILITLDPTHRQPTRRWPMERFARMLALVAEAVSGQSRRPRFLPLWGPGEEEDIQTLIRLVREAGAADTLLLPDRLLGLREAAACIEAASLHVGNCSAPRHMAVAVGTPSLTAMGSTGPEWTCPPVPGMRPDHLDCSAGFACQPCESNHCSRNRDGNPPCLDALLPETMAHQALSLLGFTDAGVSGKELAEATPGDRA